MAVRRWSAPRNRPDESQPFGTWIPKRPSLTRVPVNWTHWATLAPDPAVSVQVARAVLGTPASISSHLHGGYHPHQTWTRVSGFKPGAVVGPLESSRRSRE